MPSDLRPCCYRSNSSFFAGLERMFPFYDDRVRVVSAGSYLRFRLFWSLALVDTLPFFPGKAEGRRTHAASNRL